MGWFVLSIRSLHYGGSVHLHKTKVVHLNKNVRVLPFSTTDMYLYHLNNALHV